MIKIDHRKTLKHLYHPSSNSPSIVDVPAMNYLMVDGQGKPDGLQFQQAAGVLYPLAYTLKWMVRLASDIDYHVMPMEVLWVVNREKKEFFFTMMLMQPEYVTVDLVAHARLKVQNKVDAQQLANVRFDSHADGICVQYLHVGAYEKMNASGKLMEDYAEQQGYAIPVHCSHDIYLNDVRKTKPENLKSIMRYQAVKIS
ncbi:MAG: hypothetical protein FP831_08780 [Anaerolineae bacterium]|nr:hypothetical protein [Anaerolineae bacterium]